MKSVLRHRILTLLTGIATAGVIVFSQLFYFQAATYCQEKAQTEKSAQDTGSEKTYVSIPSSTISSSTHVEINQGLSFVLEVFLENETKEETSHEIIFPVNRFFQTLFRFIVSPNAP